MSRILLLCTIVMSLHNVSAQWQFEGMAAFSAGQASYQSLAINQDTIYVAFRDQANSNRATLMKFNGTSWVAVGNSGFTSSGVLYTDLKFFNNKPFVAYVDAANSNKISVKTFISGSWLDAGNQGFTNSNSSFPSMAFNGPEPYVAYQDGGNGSKVSCMKLVGATWQQVGAAGFSANVASNIGIQIVSGTPYVGFKDLDASGKASVMYFNGTAWVYLGGQGFTSGAIGDLAIKANGNELYVAFQDGSQSQKITVMKFNGVSWELVGTAGFSAGTADHVDLTFHNNTPYVVFQDAGNGFKATCMKFDGTAWVNVGVPGFTPSQSIYNSIGFKDTIPYMAFQDYASGQYKTSVMKYIPCYAPDIPTVSLAFNTICAGDSVEITITSGSLNSALEWTVYAGACSGVSLGSSSLATFKIAPSSTATLYVRGEGGCVTPGTCGSTVITVNSVENGISQNGDILGADASIATYQWLDCGANFAELVNETNQQFTVTSNGDYAVEITQNGCVDTSYCIQIDNIGWEENKGETWNLVANQATGLYFVSGIEGGFTFEVYSLTGSSILKGYSTGEIWCNQLPSGVYLLRVQQDNYVRVFKCVMK